MFEQSPNLTDTAELSARVDRGVAVLDKVRPGWRSEVNVADAHNVLCVAHGIAGQLFGDSITGQMESVGIDTTPVLLYPRNSDAYQDALWECTMAFVGLGFVVQSVDRVPTPPALAEVFKMLTGRNAPKMTDAPRDDDVCDMESEALVMYWQRAVSAGQ